MSRRALTLALARFSCLLYLRRVNEVNWEVTVFIGLCLCASVCVYSASRSGSWGVRIICEDRLFISFLADRTNSRAYATVLRLSVRLSVRRL